MKILVLTSRYTATRDIIGEDFGRQTRLFAALKRRGHDITFYVADYRKKERKNLRLHGIGVLIRPFGMFSFFAFVGGLRELLAGGRWDVFVATGDPLWGVIGYALKGKGKFVYDWHDNYATYLTYKIPFIPMLSRFATKKSPYVTAVTYTLRKKLRKWRSRSIEVIENGVDRSLFRPLPRSACRKELGLPQKSFIVAYTGSLHRYEGTHRLLEMFSRLRKDMDCKLVIAGRMAGNGEFSLGQEGIIYLGSVDQRKVVKVINAADVAIIPYDANIQTTYGFPYKLFEYMACKVPLVATRVGDIPLILKRKQGHLCSADDIDDMVAAVKRNKGKSRVDYSEELRGHTWDDLAKRFERYVGGNK